MRALTIHQPWAELIARGEKCVENRTWRTHYRGPLAIHASCRRPSGEELAPWGLAVAELEFGAIVAVAELVDCLDLAQLRILAPSLTSSRHAEGPICWVLETVRRLEEPVPCPGRQGLWTPRASIVAELGG